MILRLRLAVSWLEQKSKTLKEVSKDESFEFDYHRGFSKGIEFAVQQYEGEIERLRQIIDGYLEEDVDLSGMEDEAHVS